MHEMPKKEVKWIAITGVIGSGKSSVMECLRSLGHQVLDCDEIAHECLNVGEQAYLQVLEKFPPSILNRDGSIQRKALANIIFNDENAKKLLESIVHPQVLNKLNQAKALCESNLLFVEVPLLFECGWEGFFDEVWVVAASHEAIIQRLQEKRLMNLEEIQARLVTQIPLDVKVKKADFEVMNDEGLEKLSQQIRDVLKREAYE